MNVYSAIKHAINMESAVKFENMVNKWNNNTVLTI